jgi:hypothetical protein
MSRRCGPGEVAPDAVRADEIQLARWEMGDLPGLVAVPRRWRRDKAAHRTHCSPDGGAEGRTVSTGSSSPDCSPAACAD